MSNYTISWHLFACTWVFVSAWLQPSQQGSLSWIAVDLECNGWAYSSALSVYLRATYFSLTVLSTVGYGDIKPYTTVETAFMLFQVCDQQ